MRILYASFGIIAFQWGGKEQFLVKNHHELTENMHSQRLYPSVRIKIKQRQMKPKVYFVHSVQCVISIKLVPLCITLCLRALAIQFRLLTRNEKLIIQDDLVWRIHTTLRLIEVGSAYKPAR